MVAVNPVVAASSWSAGRMVPQPTFSLHSERGATITMSRVTSAASYWPGSSVYHVTIPKAGVCLASGTEGRQTYFLDGTSRGVSCVQF